MDTVTDSIRGKVWEVLVSERQAAEYSRRFPIVNLRHEMEKVRLRMVSDSRPAAEARAAEPGLEDLFIYHFGNQTAHQAEEEL